MSLGVKAGSHEASDLDFEKVFWLLSGDCLGARRQNEGGKPSQARGAVA